MRTGRPGRHLRFSQTAGRRAKAEPQGQHILLRGVTERHIPMNHTNKDGTSSADSGEGRPLIKENARQPNTYPTQSGKGVSQGLADVRKAARDNKEMKFIALLHHLSPPKFDSVAVNL
jgi:hypothetical protein